MSVISIRPDDNMQEKIKTLCLYYSMTQQELIRFMINDWYKGLIDVKGIK